MGETEKVRKQPKRKTRTKIYLLVRLLRVICAIFSLYRSNQDGFPFHHRSYRRTPSAWRCRMRHQYIDVRLTATSCARTAIGNLGRPAPFAGQQLASSVASRPKDSLSNLPPSPSLRKLGGGLPPKTIPVVSTLDVDAESA